MASSYTIEFKTSAAKEFNGLPVEVQDSVLEVLEVLRRNPATRLLKVKKLKTTLPLFRIRVGDYRVVYEVLGRKLVIVVVRVGHRSDVYRGL